MDNPKMTEAFAMVGRFRDVPREQVFAAVATADGSTAKLTYGHIRDLLSAAFEAGDRLQCIASWHIRETGAGGTVGNLCVECGAQWPCATRRLADGEPEDEVLGQCPPGP